MDISDHRKVEVPGMNSHGFTCIVYEGLGKSSQGVRTFRLDRRWSGPHTCCRILSLLAAHLQSHSLNALS